MICEFRLNKAEKGGEKKKKRGREAGSIKAPNATYWIWNRKSISFYS